MFKRRLFIPPYVIEPQSSLPQGDVDAKRLHGFKTNWTNSQKKNLLRIKYKHNASGVREAVLWQLCHMLAVFQTRP